MSSKKRAKSRYLLAAMDFGYTFLASVGMFAGAGWWLDNRFQTTPWFFLAGVGLGITVGFRSLFRRLRYLERLGRSSPDSGDSADPDRPKSPQKGKSP